MFYSNVKGEVMVMGYPYTERDRIFNECKNKAISFIANIKDESLRNNYYKNNLGNCYILYLHILNLT